MKLKKSLWLFCASIMPSLVLAQVRLQPEDLQYLGAFRLPMEREYVSSPTETTETFSLAAQSGCFNPSGDASGSPDGFPGSLYIHGRKPAPSTGGSQVHVLAAEVSIPEPKIESSFNGANLNVARMLTYFKDPTGGLRNQTTIPEAGQRIGGMLVHNNFLYWDMYWWYGVADTYYPSHGRSNFLNASNLAPVGVWRLGDYHPGSTAGPMTEIPQAFIEANLGGGDWVGSGFQFATPTRLSSAGPSLFAYKITNPPAAHDTKVTAVPLIHYPYENSSEWSPNYRECDVWRGTAWVERGGKHAVIIAGRKGLGDVYYPDSKNPDGSVDPLPPPGHCEAGIKGWYCDSYEPVLLFYDPADLAAVAKGTKKSWETRWYRYWRLPTNIFWPNICQRLNSLSYDNKNGLLYLVQPGAYQATVFSSYPVIHVFRVPGSGDGNGQAPSAPSNLRLN